MGDFQDLVRHCSLQDMGYNGTRFIWCNKRAEGLICKKLDRALVNEEWLNQYQNSYSVFEVGSCSDHSRGRFVLEAEARSGRKPFKFMNIITRVPQFMQTVESYWESTDPLFVSTCTLFRFSKKLKGLKPII